MHAKNICFVDFSKIKLDYDRFLSLKSCRLMMFLHLESFENKFSELDFSIFQKACLWSNPLRKVNYCLHGYDIFLPEILDPFHIQFFLTLSYIAFLTSESIIPFFVEKIRHESTILRTFDSNRSTR